MQRTLRRVLLCSCIAISGLGLLHIFSKQIAWTLQTAGNHIGMLVSKRFQDDEALLKDYGHLEQYREDDAKLLASRDRVVLVGDSITAFWTDPAKSRMKKDEGNFVFRGVGGSLSSQILLRFRQDVIELHPKVVAILAGTNDILMRDDEIAFDRFRSNIITVCEMAIDNKIGIVLGSIPPQTDIGHQSDLHHMKSIPAWNAWLKSYAVQIGAGFADYYSVLVGSKHEFRQELTYDGIHPNWAGYSRMETILLNQIHDLNKVRSSRLQLPRQAGVMKAKARTQIDTPGKARTQIDTPGIKRELRRNQTTSAGTSRLSSSL